MYNYNKGVNNKRNLNETKKTDGQADRQTGRQIDERISIEIEKKKRKKIPLMQDEKRILKRCR